MTEEKMTAVEWAERITGPVHMTAVVCGIEAAAKVLRQKSGVYYADGADERAKIFRLAAEVLESEAQSGRDNYVTFDYEGQREKAFAALEGIDRELEAYRAEEKAE